MGCEVTGGIMIWNSVERFLWAIAIVIAFTVGAYFIRIGKGRDFLKEKITMYGLASLPLCFGLSLTFIYFQVLFIEGQYSYGFFCGEYFETGLEPVIYEILGKLSFISIACGGLTFSFTFEYIYKKTKYIISAFFILLIILIIIFPLEWARDVFNYPIMLCFILLIPFILYRYTKWSQVEFKSVSSFFFFSFLLYMISLVFAMRIHKKLNFYPLELGPIFLIIACILTLIPIKVNPRVLAKHPTYIWSLYAIFTLVLLITITYFNITRRLEWPFVLLFILTIIYTSIFFISVIRNIKSELMLEELTELEELKSDILAIFTKSQDVNFLTSISHELRTPLTSIIGFTSMLLKKRAGDLNEEQEKQIGIIQNSANHLRDLINDVIDIAKIDANKIVTNKEQYDLAGEIEKIKDTFSVAVKEKGLKFQVNFPKILVINSDRKLMNQILINLVNNAIKFTDKGEIIVNLKKSNDFIDLSVTDTGMGIKKEDLGKLFKPFSRIKSETEYKEGTGLGLYLSQKLAQLLDGKISVESELGEGSTFTLSLKAIIED